MYPLDEILLLTLLAVLAGADSFVDIVRFGGKKLGIVAIPKPLDLLAIEGAIVTIDALGCQCPIARKIVEKKADYSFGLKGNQGSLREDEELLVSEQKARNFAMVPMRSSRVMTIKAASRPNRKGL